MAESHDFRTKRENKNERFRLESLPEFKEGAKSDLAPHLWTYQIGYGHLIKTCDLRKECCGKTEIVRQLENPVDISIFNEMAEMEIESGYCKDFSIQLAKLNKTFNPEYKEGVSD